MQYEEIKNQVKLELKNKKAYDKILERIDEQVKITEKAQANAEKEKLKLQKLVEEKNSLNSSLQTGQIQESSNE